MSKPKKDPYEMSEEELSDSYYKAKGRRDRFNKWAPRIFVGVAGAAVLVAGAALLAGAATVAGAISIICCSATIGSLPMGLGSIWRDDREMEMRRLSYANDTRIKIAESRAEQAREQARQDLRKEFEHVAEHGGTKEAISIKGPLKLKLRDRLFAGA